MIHWGSDVPTSNGNSGYSTPASEFSGDEDLVLIKPVSVRQVFGSNPHLAGSLNQLNQFSGQTDEDFGLKGNSLMRDGGSEGGSVSSSHSNLVATLWLNRKQLRPRAKRNRSTDKLEKDDDDDDYDRDDDVKIAATRTRSRSLEDIRNSDAAGRSTPKIVLDLDAPLTINDGQDLAVYLSVVNRSLAEAKLSICLRVDCGLRKIRTRTQQVVVNAYKATQLSILLPSTELWQGMQRNERHFTILATVHNHEDGGVLSKVERVKIHWRRSSLTRTRNLLFPGTK